MNTWKFHLLPLLSLLLIVPVDVLAGDNGQMMWVLGSFREQPRAENQAQVLSQLTGQEVLIQTLLVNGSIRHRLLIQPEPDENDQTNLELLLQSGDFNDYWRTWIQGDEIGVQSIISAPARQPVGPEDNSEASYEDSFEDSYEDSFEDSSEDPFFIGYQENAGTQDDMVPYSLPERRSEKVVPLSAADSAENIRYNPASLVRQRDD